MAYEKIEVPEGVEAKIEEHGFLIVKGSKGESKRRFNDPKIILGLADGNVVLEAKKGTQIDIVDGC